MDDLEPALAVGARCYWGARMAGCQAARPAARRLGRTVRVAVVQDMYMGTAGCLESKESGKEWMWMRD